MTSNKSVTSHKIYELIRPARLLKSVISGEAYALDPDEPLGLFVIVLLVYCVIFIVAIRANGWVLTRKLGRAMIVTHIFFCVFAVVITFIRVDL